jgi:NADPH:quinone reductase
MTMMNAAVVDRTAIGGISVRKFAMPKPGTDQALIRVAATSLNYDEVYDAQTGENGSLLGVDIAGTIEEPAVNGTGPNKGARVVAFVLSGAWAEFVAVDTNAIAEIPDNVSFAQAATLPAAGMTAQLAVGRGGNLIGRKVLVTGASGGVGHLACQLATLAGAEVTGLVRRESEREMALGLGARNVVVSDDGVAAEESAPYDLILDAVGGKVLSKISCMLGFNGRCVSYGSPSGSEVTFDIWEFSKGGRTTFEVLRMPLELKYEPACQGLARLAKLISEGRLRSHISEEAPFDKIGQTAKAYMDRKIRGKAVVHIA